MNQTNDTHLKVVGYVLWIFGFMGAHRFYYGRPVTGTIWFFTAGLLLIGWIIMLIVWYVLGLPVGPDSPILLNG